MLNRLKNNKVISNGIYAYLDRGVIAVYGMLYIIYFARVLSKSEFGVFILADGIRIFAITLCDIAVGQALIYYGAGKKKEDFRDIIVNSFILKVLLFTLISSVIFLSAPLLPFLFGNNDLTSLVKLIPLLILTTLLHNAPVQILNAREQIRKIFYIDFGLFLIFLAGMNLAMEYNFITNAYSAMLFLIAVRLFSSFSGYFFLRDIFFTSAFKIDVRIIKDLYSYAKSSFANSLGVLIFSKTDIYMIGIMLNPASVGLYASAALIISFFKQLNGPLNMVVFPAISKLNSENTPDLNAKIGRIYRKTSIIAVTLSFPVSFLLLIYPEELLLLLYGGKYLEGAGLVRIFALWGLLLSFYRCAASILNGVGKPEINAKFTWIAALVNVLLNLPLIYYFHTVGAASASLASGIILFILYAFTLQKLFQVFSFSTLNTFTYSLRFIFSFMRGKE